MTETRIHIISGEVVLNPKPRPTEADYTWFTLDNAPTFHEYKFTEALAEWKKNCIPCENADWVKDENTQTMETFERPIIIFDWDKQDITTFTPGQKVLAEGNVVTKII